MPNTRNADADRIGIACIEHIHQVGINWLLVGLFQFDLVAYIGGGQAGLISRVIYTVVGIAALWCISLLFKEHEPEHHV